MFDQGPVHERVTENEEPQQLRAAVYARTSSKDQEYGYSLEAQVRQSVNRCESLGWRVRFVFRDAAKSGKDTDRPMFRKMLSAAEKQAFDVLVFWKLDRFSRSLMHAVQLEEELREHDVNLYSITQQIDTTSATGRFNFRNIASAAEFERDMIKQRTRMGLQELASKKRWPNDSPPLGYQLDAERRLEIVENEADLVREIFATYVEEWSMPAVAEILNKRGVSTQQNKEWTTRAIGEILRNEIYKGLYEVADVSEHVSEYQIVDTETFEEVTSIRHRFQKQDASQPSMADSRKEQAIERMREMYRRYRTDDSAGSNYDCS